jgi:GNAT superfamily N-acetyltransferase
MIKFQVEPWARVLPELKPLFSELWEDVAVDKDRFRAECDEEKYATLDRVGLLHVVTARKDDQVIGYFVVLVQPNPHYKDAGLMAFTDMYYLAPAHRKGLLGLQLFSFMERSLKRRGVVKFYTSHKLHRSRASMFALLGFKPTDIVYSKIL